MDLDVLVGEWKVTAIIDGKTMSVSNHSFAWIEDGAFLTLRGAVETLDDAWKGAAPQTVSAVIGRDDRSGRYGYLYTDSRGVSRVYEMSLDDRELRIWGRAGETFFQRFFGQFSEDGQTIEGRWERSTDAEKWELDFEQTYARVG